MKKFRKLVPAFAMLLVSATVLASTTFAWFSMNNKVTATGMEVTAKANTQYLIVGQTVDGDGKVVNAAADKNTVAMLKAAGFGKANGTDGIHVFPVSKVTDLESIKDVTGTKIVNYTGTTTPIAVGDYFTANSPKLDAVTGENNGISNVKKVDAALTEAAGTVDGKYFAKYTTYLGLADGSDKIDNKKLTVKLLNENADSAALDNSIRAVVVINGVAKTLSAQDLATGVDFDITLDNAVKANANVAVSVFLYIDGYAENVHDSTAKKLTGKLGLEFTVDLGA